MTDPHSNGNGTKTPPTTTNAGIPVASDNESLTAGAQGPILLHDHYLVEKLAQFNRERVPERVVHAKGGGAFGELEITHDISRYTKADFLQPGKKTEVLARFSTVAGEQGSPDTWRDPRGFALKFYTEQGNHDLVGNNTPVFFIKIPASSPTSSAPRSGVPTRVCATITSSGITGRSVPSRRTRSPGCSAIVGSRRRGGTRTDSVLTPTSS